MGTPDFAVPTFEKILESKDHNIKAVFTAPPKPKGRGMNIEKSSIHKKALNHNIPIYTPKTLRNKESLELIESILADIIVVVAYGLIIPGNIISSKKFGCLNIHPSKLPKYRGAAPLQRTIINGDKESAVCIMQMDEGLDTGDVILSQKLPLHHRITLQELHNKCAMIGAELLIKTLNDIETLPRIAQNNDGVVYAHKLTKEEGLIDWKKSAYEIDCMVRGMNPWPGAYFKMNDKIIKIIESDYNETSHNYHPGTIINDKDNKFKMACGSGILHIKIVQPAGKNKMQGEDFLRGYIN